MAGNKLEALLCCPKPWDQQSGPGERSRDLVTVSLPPYSLAHSRQSVNVC